jgi:hypothetical protein
MRARWATGAAVVLALLAGCGGDDDTAASPTTLLPPRGPATDAPTTTTTVGVDEVPDEITVDYVQRVMDALDESWGAMFRQYQADGGPTVDNLAWLAELYTEPAYSQMEQFLGEIAGDEFEGVPDEPGDPETTIEDVISGSDDCIFVRSARNFGPVFQDEPGRTDGLIWLSSRQEPSARNSTIWTLRADAEFVPLDEVIDPCA